MKVEENTTVPCWPIETVQKNNGEELKEMQLLCTKEMLSVRGAQGKVGCVWHCFWMCCYASKAKPK